MICQDLPASKSIHRAINLFNCLFMHFDRCIQRGYSVRLNDKFICITLNIKLICFLYLSASNGKYKMPHRTPIICIN